MKTDLANDREFLARFTVRLQPGEARFACIYEPLETGFGFAATKFGISFPQDVLLAVLGSTPGVSTTASEVIRGRVRPVQIQDLVGGDLQWYLRATTDVRLEVRPWGRQHMETHHRYTRLCQLEARNLPRDRLFEECQLELEMEAYRHDYLGNRYVAFELTGLRVDVLDGEVP